MKKISIYSNRTKALALDFPQKLIAMPKVSYLVNVRFLLISGVIFIISFVAFYIFQVSLIISQGYQIQSYEEKIKNISEENKILGIDSIKISSLENIDSRIQQLGFEKIEKIHYIKILESSMVKVGSRIE